MEWGEFAEACPELADAARSRFQRDELVLLGTLGRDGWPRISPCEVDFVAGAPFFGMMWRSPKALDLSRDARLMVHSVQCDRHAAEPDIKLWGRAVEVTEPELRQAYREAIRKRIGWAPDEPEFHLFMMSVERAASVWFHEGREDVVVWNPAEGTRRWTKSGG